MTLDVRIYEGTRGKVGCGCAHDLHDWGLFHGGSILVGMVVEGLLCPNLSS